ncbi:ABC transporter permease [Borrelia miyamotoi]|uniref:ABC transporter permease n=1 Tax=Borrelia miyamotoi TaxID=47466 RepID=A0AAQ2WWL4_9SPIR|nr:ABC transporter permease subunit [Borrelia miyamotoi]AGT27582.1 ABC transporter permease [Borrelia miyamotoi LB-2001]AJA58755.1 ABC transporter permease [Borrelia miyamotoi]AOW95838.1 ABC transporter permease [Borrelia miyamotoi]QTL83728.1 ABC transporter permease [Borrelia miyamotoi]WAZ84967.1 ABC transporter permease [Borrelia miyamotoi]
MNRIILILYILFLSIFIIFPVVIIIVLGFLNEQNELTFANFTRLLEPSYLKIFSRSINFALITTIFCMLIGYPTAWFISMSKKNIQNMLIIMIILPMWINTLLRTYAWIRILGKNGIINNLLEAIGLKPIELLYNEKAVIIGMVYNFLPFMVLPIYIGLSKIKYEYIEAARDLGARTWQILLYIKLPLTLSYLATGIIMVFIPSITVFIISDLLGGSKQILIGNLIEKQFLFVEDWHTGASISFIVMIVILTFNLIILKLMQKNNVKSGY